MGRRKNLRCDLSKHDKALSWIGEEDPCIWRVEQNQTHPPKTQIIVFQLLLSSLLKLNLFLRLFSLIIIIIICCYFTYCPWMETWTIVLRQGEEEICNNNSLILFYPILCFWSFLSLALYFLEQWIFLECCNGWLALGSPNATGLLALKLWRYIMHHIFFFFF